MWKDSWWLAKQEIKFQWPAFISTLMVTLIIALLTVSLLNQYVSKTFEWQDIYFNYWVLDLIFIGITPSFAALFMSSPYLSVRTIKEDPFGKRMEVYRSLPIPIEVLSKSRILLMFATLFVMSTAFYGTLLIALPASFYQHIPYTEFVIFILIWFGYAMGLGVLNTYIEFGTNGKILFLFPVIFLVLFFLLSFFMYNVAGYSIVEGSLLLIREFGWFAAVISLLFGFLGCYTINKLLKKRFLTRDYV